MPAASPRWICCTRRGQSTGGDPYCFSEAFDAASPLLFSAPSTVTLGFGSISVAPSQQPVGCPIARTCAPCAGPQHVDLRARQRFRRRQRVAAVGGGAQPAVKILKELAGVVGHWPGTAHNRAGARRQPCPG